MRPKHSLIAFFILILLLVLILLFENPFTPPKKENKKLFPHFNPQEISVVHIQHLSQEVRLFKEKGEWRVASMAPSPLEGEGRGEGESNVHSFSTDTDRLQSLFTTIANLESSDLISSNPEKYNLFQVTATLGTTVELEGGTQSIHFILGKSGPDFSSTYLRKLDPPEDKQVYLISEELRGTFTANLFEWRNKKVIDRDVAEIEQITLLRNKDTITLKRNSEKKWIWMEKPNSSLDAEFVESLARNLAHLKALSVGETVDPLQAGLEKSENQVTIKFSNDEKEIQLKLGKMKVADTYYAQIVGLKDWEGEIFTVNEAVAEKIKKIDEEITTP
jgi:hypothetical protein